MISEPEKGLVELRFNRPLKHNAVDYDVMEALKVNLYSLQTRKDIKALIITGEGDKAFCSGGDVEAFQYLKTKDEAYHMLSKMGEILYELMTFPLPTYALINGIALGGGCEIATACDFRMAKKGVSIGFIQGNLSITTGWGGATMLHEKLAYEQAMFVLFSAKKMSSEEAESTGFVQKIVSEDRFKAEAYEYIQQSLVEDTKVLRAYKAVKINQWIQSNLYSRMMSEIHRCAELWASDDHHRAVTNFLSRKSNK